MQIACVINAENFGRHIDQLYRELTTESQASLQRALLDEEYRYGFRSCQLDLVEQHIAEAADRTDKQLSLLNRLEREGAAIHSAPTGQSSFIRS